MSEGLGIGIDILDADSTQKATPTTIPSDELLEDWNWSEHFAPTRNVKIYATRRRPV